MISERQRTPKVDRKQEARKQKTATIQQSESERNRSEPSGNHQLCKTINIGTSMESGTTTKIYIWVGPKGPDSNAEPKYVAIEPPTKTINIGTSMISGTVN